MKPSVSCFQNTSYFLVGWIQISLLHFTILVVVPFFPFFSREIIIFVSCFPVVLGGNHLILRLAWSPFYLVPSSNHILPASNNFMSASNSEFFVQSTISVATRRHQIRTMCATPGWTTIGWSSVVKLGMPCSSTAGVSSRWCFHVRPVSPDRCSVWHPLAAASSQVRWSLFDCGAGWHCGGW